jgi:hypothetical protein
VNDNLFGATVFALIVAVAIAAATAIVGTEIDLARADVQATAQPTAPASAAPPAIVELPPVTVVGHRHVLDEDAGLAVALAPAPTTPTVH